jgi:hypothetical protein
MAGEDPPEDEGGAWKEVHARYIEVLGPEAPTIGPPQEFLDKNESAT